MKVRSEGTRLSGVPPVSEGTFSITIAFKQSPGSTGYLFSKSQRENFGDYTHVYGLLSVSDGTRRELVFVYYSTETNTEKSARLQLSRRIDDNNPHFLVMSVRKKTVTIILDSVVTVSTCSSCMKRA